MWRALASILLVALGVALLLTLWSVIPVFRVRGRWGSEVVQVALLLPLTAVISAAYVGRLWPRLQARRYAELVAEMEAEVPPGPPRSVA